MSVQGLREAHNLGFMARGFYTERRPLAKVRISAVS